MQWRSVYTEKPNVSQGIMAVFTPEKERKNVKTDNLSGIFSILIHRGYYTVARRYEFYFRVAKQYFTNGRSEWVKYCFCQEKIKFISSSRRVMFFLLYRQTDIDKIIEGYDRNYVIYKLTCEIMENKPLGSLM